MEALYKRFAAIWANGEPIRDHHELAALVRASELSEGEVSDEWLRALPDRWVYGETDEPFSDERSNRNYRRELERG